MNSPITVSCISLNAWETNCLPCQAFNTSASLLDIYAQFLGYNVYQQYVVPDQDAVHTSPRHPCKNAEDQRAQALLSTAKMLYFHGSPIHKPIPLSLRDLLLAITNALCFFDCTILYILSTSASGSRTCNSNVSKSWELSCASSRFVHKL